MTDKICDNNSVRSVFAFVLPCSFMFIFIFIFLSNLHTVYSKHYTLYFTSHTPHFTPHTSLHTPHIHTSPLTLHILTPHHTRFFKNPLPLSLLFHYNFLHLPIHSHTPSLLPLPSLSSRPKLTKYSTPDINRHRPNHCIHAEKIQNKKRHCQESIR